MRQGKVEWYSKQRGFGIVSSPAEDGSLERFFAHVSKIVRSPEKIEQGQPVSFDVSAEPVRRVGDLPMAINVVIELPRPKPVAEIGANSNSGAKL